MRLMVLLLAAASIAGCATTTGVARPSPFPTAAPFATSAPVEATRPALVRTAFEFQGVPYRLGGETPATGFDCSGYVRYVFAANQIELPRTVVEQFTVGERVETGDIQPGDLLFFATITPGPSHVAIVATGHQFIHAPGSNGVVRTDSLDAPYWRDRFLGARRVF
jgi:cell wall-associated NlpC family hydrolase